MTVHAGTGFVTVNNKPFLSNPNSRDKRVNSTDSREQLESTVRLEDNSDLPVTGRDMTSDTFRKSRHFQMTKFPPQKFNADKFSKSITYIKNGKKTKLDLSAV